MVFRHRAGDVIVGCIFVVSSLYLAGSSLDYLQNVNAEIKLDVQLLSVSVEQYGDSTLVIVSLSVINPSITVPITIGEYGVSLSLDRMKISSSQVGGNLVLQKSSTEVLRHQVFLRDNDRKVFEEIYSNAKSWVVEVVLRIREPLQFSPIYTLTRPIR